MQHVLSINNANHQQGFTLIEILIAIALVVASSLYFVQLFTENFESRQAKQGANELLTLSRSISTYYGQKRAWPIKALNNCDSEEVLKRLGEFAKGFDAKDFKFKCNDDSYLTVSMEVDSSALADNLVAFLPLAEANGNSIEMTILKPRLAPNYQLIKQTVKSDGYAYQDYPADCLQPQISVSATQVCTQDDSPLGAFRLLVEEQGKGWRLSLMSRADAPDAEFQQIKQCKGAPLQFRAVVFCSSS